MRSIAGTDFVINQPVEGFINVAGIQSPGLTAAPAIAEMVIEMLSSRFELRRKKEVRRPEWIRLSEMDDEGIKKVIEEDEDFGEIVCLCNMVSKAEILRAIEEGECFDTVRHLTWAGMDCCKCHAEIMRLIEERTGKARKEIEGSDIVW